MEVNVAPEWVNEGVKTGSDATEANLLQSSFWKC